jgi:hypothetical protein
MQHFPGHDRAINSDQGRFGGAVRIFRVSVTAFVFLAARAFDGSTEFYAI